MPWPEKPLTWSCCRSSWGSWCLTRLTRGAQEAHAELENPQELQFLGPTPENSVAGQIDIVTTAATQGMNAIMISNNAGDQIVPAATDAKDAGDDGR